MHIWIQVVYLHLKHLNVLIWQGFGTGHLEACLESAGAYSLDISCSNENAESHGLICAFQIDRKQKVMFS